MKVTWEEKDINPGRIYSKEGIDEKWIIGYLSAMDGPECYVSVSNRDGMVTDPRTKEQMAQLLTENGYLPVELL